MSSVFSNPSVLDKYFKKELDRGPNTGLFSEDPFNGLSCNCFGLVPYPVWGEERLIIDFVFRKGNSVNELPDSVATAQYSSVYDAIPLMIKCGRGALLVKFGFKSHIEFCRLIQVIVFYFQAMGKKDFQ